MKLLDKDKLKKLILIQTSKDDIISVISMIVCIHVCTYVIIIITTSFCPKGEGDLKRHAISCAVVAAEVGDVPVLETQMMCVLSLA